MQLLAVEGWALLASAQNFSAESGDRSGAVAKAGGEARHGVRHAAGHRPEGLEDMPVRPPTPPPRLTEGATAAVP